MLRDNGSNACSDPHRARTPVSAASQAREEELPDVALVLPRAGRADRLAPVSAAHEQCSLNCPARLGRGLRPEPDWTLAVAARAHLLEEALAGGIVHAGDHLSECRRVEDHAAHRSTSGPAVRSIARGAGYVRANSAMSSSVT